MLAPSARKSLAAPLRRWAWRQTVKVGNRTAGLPIAIRALFGTGRTPSTVVRKVYARHYWTKNSPGEWVDLVLALFFWPVIVVGLALWLTARNGRAVRDRTGRSSLMQFFDQLRLYPAAGVLAPWYYAFELFDRPRGSDAREFIYRCESKAGVFAFIKQCRPPTSIVSDKARFAEHCRRTGTPTIRLLAIARGGELEWLGEPADRAADWFVKPVEGKGGKGIQRWDYGGNDRFRSPGGETLHREELIARITSQSVVQPLLVQPRIECHPGLLGVCNGALSTVRALTCLDENGEPRLHGAVLRMAVGRNCVIDNFHAGGIACGIDLATGDLGPASNLGVDARLGWLDAHPDSGAPIRGQRFPEWVKFAPFVEDAHRAFADRVVIGWDVALTGQGLIIVEANGAPDLDIMQRIMRQGLMTTGFAKVLAHHAAVAVARDCQLIAGTR